MTMVAAMRGSGGRSGGSMARFRQAWADSSHGGNWAGVWMGSVLTVEMRVLVAGPGWAAVGPRLGGAWE